MKRKTLGQVTYEYIVNKIKNREYWERESITEYEVSEALEISRTPVRKAFERLIEDGYLEKDKNVGVRVKEGQEIPGGGLRFEILRSKDGQFYFNLIASNHEIISTSELYTRKENALKTANLIKEFIKKLFCRHDHTKRVFRELHVEGRIYRNYGNECLDCGRTRWL